MRDHPRGCGEHPSSGRHRQSSMGSSPRMRGAHISSAVMQDGVGIIPADAGSTQAAAAGRGTDTDHPRGCGEHVGDEGSLGKGQGSSPRMRGARYCFGLDGRCWRIIPADAGSTRSGLPKRGRLWDHPRGCGEHNSSSSPSYMVTGSSPRMRGARLLHTLYTGHERIIPADAGSTDGGECHGRPCRDHPRGCGEHCMSASARTAALGSSPRMRGAQMM